MLTKQDFLHLESTVWLIGVVIQTLEKDTKVKTIPKESKTFMPTQTHCKVAVGAECFTQKCPLNGPLPLKQKKSAATDKEHGNPTSSAELFHEFVQRRLLRGGEALRKLSADMQIQLCRGSACLRPTFAILSSVLIHALKYVNQPCLGGVTNVDER